MHSVGELEHDGIDHVIVVHTFNYVHGTSIKVSAWLSFYRLFCAYVNHAELSHNRVTDRAKCRDGSHHCLHGTLDTRGDIIKEPADRRGCRRRPGSLNGSPRWYSSRHHSGPVDE